MTTHELVQAAVEFDFRYDPTMTDYQYKEFILKHIPKGWVTIFTDAWDEINKTAKIGRVYYHLGVLKFELRDKKDKTNRIVRWLIKGVAQESTITCLLSGERGIRRKGFRGWPPLVERHFVEYANEVSDQGIVL